MKKINNMTVFEPTDKCSLDEYSQKAAIEVPELIKKAKEEVNQKVIEISENDIKQDNEIATLKTNYTKLQERNTKLEAQIKKDRENMINLEVEGQSIHVEDSSDLEGKLEALGNVEQETREGYNLCPDDINNWESGQYGGDGNKAPDNNAIRLKELLKIDSNSSYFLRTFSTDYNFIIRAYNANKVFTRSLGSQADSSIIKINDNEEYLGVSLWSPKGKPSTYDNYVELFKNNTIKPFITTESNKEKPYEPYGASPSPEYPSTVRAVGDNINLWDKENMLVELGGYSGSNGNKYDSTTRIRNTKDIELKKDTYTLSAENSKLISIYIVDLKKELSSNGDSVTFTLEKDNTIRFTIENTALLNTEIKLERGNKKTGYSPYGQGSVEIKKTSANYYNVKSYAGSQQPPVDKEDWITLKGSNTGENDTYLNYFTKNLDLVVGKKYWIIAEIKSVSGNGNFNITSQAHNGGQFKGHHIEISNLSAGKSVIFQEIAVETSIEQGLRTFISIPGGQSANITFRISVLETEPNKSNWKYVPYKKETKILPIQEPMLEGDYFIKEVDGWKEVHNWENKVINGTETMMDGNPSVADNTLVVSIPRKDSGLTSDKINIISEQFKGNTTANLWVTDKEGISLSAGYISVRINRKRANTLEEVKEYLKQNNIKCFLKKSTENKLLCTPEQIEILDELDNFQTYKPVTNITTDSIAKLKLKYIADTKTYIDNKTSNLEQQLNTINQLLSTTRTSSVLLDNLQSDIESEVL